MSYGVTVPEIDAALAARYAGLVVGGKSVEVFIEEPSSEEFPERTFPSITVKFTGLIFDAERAHTDDDEGLQEQLSLDTSPVPPAPPEAIMRNVPIPYRVQYELQTWIRALSVDDRDMLLQAVIGRTHPRGFLSSVGANASDLWALWSGGLANLDSVETDEVIFNKVLALEVIADIIPTTDTTNVKTVTEIQLDFHRVERDPKTGIIDESTKFEDVSILFTDTTEGPV